MTPRPSTHVALVFATAALFLSAASAQTPARGGTPAPPAQGAPAQGGPPQGGGGGAGGRGGRGGGLPGATPEQNQAVTDMNAALAPLVAAATTARNDLASVAMANVRNDAGIKAAAEKLAAAELAVAIKRAEEFAKLQAGPNKLNADQITALIATSAGGRAGGFGGRGGN